VSLGRFQRVADARSMPALAAATLVRRPSGGGALVHGTDLTYALAVPRSHPWGRSPQTLYDITHAALVQLLEARGVVARRHPGHPASPADPLLCFSRRAAGDVVAAASGRVPAPDDPKILGSAQRRLAAAVVQHGSLLLAANESVAEVARHPGLAELGASVPEECLCDLGAAWAAGIAAAAGLHAEWHEDFAAERPAQVAAAAARFRDPRWVERR